MAVRVAWAMACLGLGHVVKGKAFVAYIDNTVSGCIDQIV